MNPYGSVWGIKLKWEVKQISSHVDCHPVAGPDTDDDDDDAPNDKVGDERRGRESKVKAGKESLGQK